MTEALSLLFNLSVLIFVLASMFGMGLSLTIKQIVEPMRNVTLVLKALVANFILAPLLAFALARLIGLDQQLTIGLFILGVCAGAPLLAKYAQLAKGDLAFTLGLMVLLMVVTIILAPLVLPLLLPGVQVDAWGMIQSLILTMLIAVQNFAEPQVILMVLAGAVLMLVITTLVAGEFGKRYQAEAPAGESA